jgi:hypothetical protein
MLKDVSNTAKITMSLCPFWSRHVLITGTSLRLLICGELDNRFGYSRLITLVVFYIIFLTVLDRNSFYPRRNEYAPVLTFCAVDR